MSPDDSPAILGQQLAYYRARAAEYDQWWLRQGRYDRGSVLNTQWFGEGEEVAAALLAHGPFGRVLELACGTGIWTEQLLPFASDLTAVDGSPEMIAINAARLGSTRVRYIESDLFQWQPTDQFERLRRGQPADFRCASSRCISGIKAVDVIGDINGHVANTGPNIRGQG